MATFVLIPGAGGHAAYWNRLVPELEQRGHEAIAVDIPENDPELGLPEYADIVVRAIDGRHSVVLLAQSLGGFTAPMVATRASVAMIVFLNAMIPRPGEQPGEWEAATGAAEARRAAAVAAGRSTEFDLFGHFLHDVPDDAREELLRGEAREPADTPFGQPCDFERWPDVPIKVLVGTDDRWFPADFQRRVAKDRLGVDADLITGGHLAALSNPAGIADRLVEYVSDAA